MEPRLFACVVSLAQQLLSGTVMDAGANDGISTVMLATSLPHFDLLSVEPILLNLAKIRLATRNLTSRVTIIHGGVGAVPGNDTYPALLDYASSNLPCGYVQKLSGGWQQKYRCVGVPTERFCFRTRTCNPPHKRAPMNPIFRDAAFALYI